MHSSQFMEAFVEIEGTKLNFSMEPRYPYRASIFDQKLEMLCPAGTRFVPPTIGHFRLRQWDPRTVTGMVSTTNSRPIQLWMMNATEQGQKKTSWTQSTGYFKLSYLLGIDPTPASRKMNVPTEHSKPPPKKNP